MPCCRKGAIFDFNGQHETPYCCPQPISCSAKSCSQFCAVSLLHTAVVKNVTDHVWNAIRHGICVPAIWADHRAFVYVDLQQEFQLNTVVTSMRAKISRTSSNTWCRFFKNSSSTISGISSGREVSPNCARKSNKWRVMATTVNERSPYTKLARRTSLAAFTNAFHSNRGRNPLMKSALNSASRNSIVTSLRVSGKLFVVHPFAWHASRLCVMSRTIVTAFERRLSSSQLLVQ